MEFVSLERRKCYLDERNNGATNAEKCDGLVPVWRVFDGRPNILFLFSTSPRPGGFVHGNDFYFFGDERRKDIGGAFSVLDGKRLGRF